MDVNVENTEIVDVISQNQPVSVNLTRQQKRKQERDLAKRQQLEQKLGATLSRPEFQFIMRDMRMIYQLISSVTNILVEKGMISQEDLVKAGIIEPPPEDLPPPEADVEPLDVEADPPTDIEEVTDEPAAA